MNKTRLFLLATLIFALLCTSFGVAEENLTQWAMEEPVKVTIMHRQNPAVISYAEGENDQSNVYFNAYRDQLGMDITHVQAQERFLTALEGVEDADKKRTIIGVTLQSILDECMAEIGDVSAVLRGTNCNDILTQSERTRRPAPMADVPVIEPLRELFKSEIRMAGSTLMMPPEILSRQSFPGSGLALRILGPVTPARLQTLRAVDRIFTEELSASGQLKKLLQHFAVLSPMAGDDPRAMIALRAVNSNETTSAYAARLPYDLLERVMDRIRRERPEVSRVVYDLTSYTRRSGVEWQ